MTAMQELFSQLEKEHPSLFNIYSVSGRDFINSYYKFLEMEKQQIVEAANSENSVDINYGEQYYNDKFNK